jgi:hypothetical protein
MPNGVLVYNQFMTEQRHLGKKHFFNDTKAGLQALAENHFTDASYVVR